MFDYLRCEMPMPDGRSVPEVEFQTKSLWCCMDRFTITAAGRLIYHRHRYEAGQADDERLGFGRPVWVGDFDMDYHGDLAISGGTVDGDDLGAWCASRTGRSSGYVHSTFCRRFTGCG